MKIGSRLLRELNNNSAALDGVQCQSFFCRWDVMVFPGWRAVLPVGSQEEIPVWTHQQLIGHPRSLQRLSEALRR